MIYLIDADAFLCLRSLRVDGRRLLALILQSLLSDEPAVLTGYIAYHELSTVPGVIESFVRAKVLRVQDVSSGTPEFESFRAMKREAHKGEAEALAWAVHQKPKPLFVSRDTRALDVAGKHRVPHTDVMGFVVESIERGLLTRQDAADVLTPWDAPEQQICRPRDYKGFATTYKARLSRKSRFRHYY